MQEDIQEVLLDEEAILGRVRELAEGISEDYAGCDLVLICILKGAAIFLADLVRHITIPITLDFMATSSYGRGTESTGVVRILKDLDEPVEGRHVLIVEDIIDSGLTLKYLYDNLASRHPASLKICTLLDKPERRLVNIKADYNGFLIPDEFVVGYGLDYAEKYRNLPFIGILKREIYAPAGGKNT
ncbi:MAG: hypoxanthine phosphoribosyltransferase [Firmicutes bacterium]|nr:hypoxanthine phosphoribosyltransferase [Bacillota bacterium]